MNENAALFFVDRNVNGSLKDKTAFIEYGNSSNSISYYDLYDQSSRLKNLFLKYNITIIFCCTISCYFLGMS